MRSGLSQSLRISHCTTLTLVVMIRDDNLPKYLSQASMQAE